MKIAVIGAGNVGKSLGGAFARAGHSVVFASKSAETSRKAAQIVGATAAGSAREAAQGAEVIVLAIPYVASGREVATEIAPVVAGKIVIDATNPLGAGGSLATKGGVSAAEEFAKWMPGARLVKAFNTVFATVQADPRTHGMELDGLFATDDEAARATMGELMKAIGFRPVWVGPLARAGELEALAYLNIHLQMTTGGDWRSAFVLVGPPKAALEHGTPAAAGSRKR